jgi:hypothetical protein
VPELGLTGGMFDVDVAFAGGTAIVYTLLALYSKTKKRKKKKKRKGWKKLTELDIIDDEEPVLNDAIDDGVETPTVTGLVILTELELILALEEALEDEVAGLDVSMREDDLDVSRLVTASLVEMEAEAVSNLELDVAEVVFILGEDVEAALDDWVVEEALVVELTAVLETITAADDEEDEDGDDEGGVVVEDVRCVEVDATVEDCREEVGDILDDVACIEEEGEGTAEDEEADVYFGIRICSKQESRKVNSR